MPRMHNDKLVAGKKKPKQNLYIYIFCPQTFINVTKNVTRKKSLHTANHQTEKSWIRVVEVKFESYESLLKNIWKTKNLSIKFNYEQPLESWNKIITTFEN